MSQPSAAQQAIAWLEQQLADLNGIRNATPRDPSFKNWRQATLTIMQRIWPGEQDRQERFRRIPFSPADPRADLRTIREWYSRGCQEAARVLSSFITDIQAQGVPAQSADIASIPTSAEFAVDFPTVDLPSGDFGSAPLPEEANDVLELGPSSGSATRIPPTLQQPTPQPRTPVPGTYATFRPGPSRQPPAPPATPAAPPAVTHAMPPPPAAPQPSLRAPAPQAPPPPHTVQPAAPQSPSPSQPKKGMGARLRDLLGFAQLSAKAFTGQTREEPPAPPAPPARLEIQPVGDEVTPANTPAPAPVASQPPPVPAAMPPAASAPPALPTEEMREPGASVVMSRPTTLRGNIEKVSIESLISPEFRNAEDTASTPPSHPTPPAPPAVDRLDVPHLSPVSGTTNVVPPAPEPPVVSEPTPVLDAVAQSLADALASPSVPEPIVSTPEAFTQPAHPPVIEPAPVASEPAPPVAPVTPAAPVEAVALPASAPPTVLPTANSSGAFPLPTPSGSIPAPTSDDFTGSPSTIIQLPTFSKPASDPSATGEKPRPKRDSKVLPFTKRPGSGPVPEPEIEDAIQELPDGAPVDPEEFAQATEDFLRTSPVLGATGRKVKRGGYDERKAETREPQAREAPIFDDPDAIAVVTMLDDLAGLGVPNARHKEARARLEDLAKRIEKGDLEWAVLRKAVWFAMEYPDVARRLMPILLPWIDRAA